MTREQVCSLYVTVGVVGPAEEAAPGQADALTSAAAMLSFHYSHPDVVAARLELSSDFLYSGSTTDCAGESGIKVSVQNNEGVTGASPLP